MIDFIIVGPQRTGSTSLGSYLMQHPKVFMYGEGKKETHFFDKKYKNDKTFFRKIFNNKYSFVRGIKDPSFFHNYKVPKRVYEMFPNVKLIFIIRDPKSRAYSHYWANKKYCREKLSFYNALEKEDERVKRKEFTFGYKYIGKYHLIFPRWLEYFPRKQMMIVPSEELLNDTQKTMKKICKFLGLDYIVFEEKRENIGGEPKLFIFGQVSRVFAFLNIEKLRRFFVKINKKKNYPDMSKEESKLLEEEFDNWENKLLKVIGYYD